MKIVSIHQPGYLPWLGFFKKILYSDVFVFLDDVKYVKRQWHNRNQIRTSSGSIYLSVPIKAGTDDALNKVKISYDEKWSLIHKKTIRYNYSKASFFYKYWDFFEELYDKKFTHLIELNMEIIYYLMEKLNINKKTIFSSELDIKAKKSDLNLEICKTLGADVYLAGVLGKNYLKEEDFIKDGIKIEYQNFRHPIYTQVYKPFIPNMAAIDLLFNKGPKAADILEKSKNF